MNALTMPDNFKPKSFWERPEGNTGLIFVGMIALAAFFGLKTVLPSIIGVMDMLIVALTKGGAIAAILAAMTGVYLIVTNKKVTTLVSYFFRSIMRNITQAFVEIDPIGIMKNYIEDMRKWQSDLDKSISSLTGQVRTLKETMSLNDKKRDNAMATMSLAKQQGKVGVLSVNARQATRLEIVNKESFAPLLSTMEAHLRTICKYREVSDTIIQDLGNEIEVKSIQRKMILSSYSAMKTAVKLINGDKDKRELFDQAMEYVVEDYGMKLGEIESFIGTSKNFIDGLDMQNGVYEADALDKLKAWENKADSILLGDQKRVIMEEHQTFGNVQVLIPVNAESKYSQFLK